MGLSAQQKTNVLASLEHDFFAHMNHSRMNGIRSSHRQKKAMFEGIARNILAKYAKEEASESDEDENVSVCSNQSDKDELSLLEQTDRCSYVNLDASHHPHKDFRHNLAIALSNILSAPVFYESSLLDSRAYEPSVWDVKPPHLSPQKLRE